MAQLTQMFDKQQSPQVIAYFGEDILLDKYKKSINTFAEYMLKNPGAELIIFGHTDSKGSDEYCFELSERRTKAVKTSMMSQSVNPEKIHVIPCGKTEMIWFPEEQEWRAQENRRIAILLLR